MNDNLTLEISMAAVIASHIEAIGQAMEHMPIVEHAHLAKAVNELNKAFNVSLVKIKQRAED